jgi:hypothetical protein
MLEASDLAALLEVSGLTMTMHAKYLDGDGTEVGGDGDVLHPLKVTPELGKRPVLSRAIKARSDL